MDREAEDLREGFERAVICDSSFMKLQSYWGPETWFSDEEVEWERIQERAVRFDFSFEGLDIRFIVGEQLFLTCEETKLDGNFLSENERESSLGLRSAELNEPAEERKNGRSQCNEQSHLRCDANAIKQKPPALRYLRAERF